MSKFNIENFENGYDENLSSYSLARCDVWQSHGSVKFCGYFNDMFVLLKAIATEKIGKEEDEELIFIGTLCTNDYDMGGILNSEIFSGHFEELINFKLFEYIFKNKSLNFALDFIEETNIKQILNIEDQEQLLKIAREKLNGSLIGIATRKEFEMKSFYPYDSEEEKSECLDFYDYFLKQEFSKIISLEEDLKLVGDINTSLEILEETFSKIEAIEIKGKDIDMIENWIPLFYIELANNPKTPIRILEKLKLHNDEDVRGKADGALKERKEKKVKGRKIS